MIDGCWTAQKHNFGPSYRCWQTDGGIQGFLAVSSVHVPLGRAGVSSHGKEIVVRDSDIYRRCGSV
jgi:hypothetical protein